MYLFRFWAGILAITFALCCLNGCTFETPKKRALPRRIVVPVRIDKPRPPNKPRCPNCPRSVTASLAPVGASVGGRISPDSVPVQIDYPPELWQKNRAGRDGKGLCVWASASWAMDWHHIPGGRGLLSWMQSRDGGGWPEKFDREIEAYFRSINQPVPAYVQMEGDDLPFVQKCLANGKLVCATYNRSPTGRYNGQQISHMVCVHHCDGVRVAIGDNNFVGDNSYEWLTLEEWKSVFLGPNGKGWAIAFDAPPPPPIPHN